MVSHWLQSGLGPVLQTLYVWAHREDSKWSLVNDLIQNFEQTERMFIALICSRLLLVMTNI